MESLLAALPQISGLIEKGGIVGLLVLFLCGLIWDRTRMVKELRKAYRQRDRARIERERFRSGCLAADVKVDTSDIAAMFAEDGVD